jgi:hypothetical protein
MVTVTRTAGIDRPGLLDGVNPITGSARRDRTDIRHSVKLLM